MNPWREMAVLLWRDFVETWITRLVGWLPPSPQKTELLKAWLKYLTGGCR